MSAGTIRKLLHRDNPYAGFPLSQFAAPPHDSIEIPDIFRHVFNELRPKLMAEIGSWFGGSAVQFATLAKQLGLHDFELVCVDTWLGSPEDRLVNKDELGKFAIADSVRFGRPDYYMNFLATVLHSNCDDMVTPFPIDAIGAARFFKATKIQFDIVYVDGAHDYVGCRADIEGFWPLIRSGGLMIGDDFSTVWPGVVHAVNEFALRHDLKLQATPDSKWGLYKP